MAQSNCVSSLRGVVAFTRTPSLALCAASPSLRLAVERSACSVRCGSYKIQSHTSTHWGIKMRALTVHPSVDFTLSSIQELVGWWLRRNDGAYIMIRWDDYYLARDFTPSCALASTFQLLLRVLQLTRCHIKEPMPCLPTCKHLRMLVLMRCTFVNPYWGINWVVECPSLKELKIQKCDCVIDFRVLAKLQYLKHLTIVTSRRLRYKRYIGKCQTLETVHIEAPCRFSLASTISKLPSLLHVDIRCTSVHRIGSIQRCQLLERIIIHCETFTNMSAIGCLPRLKYLDVGSAAMKSIEWIGRCPSLTSVHFKDSTNIANISTIGRLHYITVLSIRGIDIDDIAWVRNCHILLSLVIGPCQRMADFTPISSLQYLELLYVEDASIESIEWMESCQLLKRIYMVNCPHITDFSTIGCFSQLKRLRVTHTASLEWITSIKCCEKLVALGVYYARNIVDFNPIGRLENLKDLRLSHTNFTDGGWSELLNCELLELLHVRRCVHIVDFSPIANFTCLTDLDMSETRVADIEWIGGCEMLVKLLIADCVHLVNFGPIVKLQRLEVVDLSRTNVKGVLWMRDCAALSIAIIIGCDKIVGIGSMERSHPKVIFVKTEKEKQHQLD